MSATNIKVKVTVDPAGRVLVWEHERQLPSDYITTSDGPMDVSPRTPWYAEGGCAHYILDVTLPIPALPAPTVRVLAGDDFTGLGFGPIKEGK